MLDSCGVETVNWPLVCFSVDYASEVLGDTFYLI